MIKSIIYFTIGGSYCHLFFQNLDENILSKSFYKHSKEKFYVNGYN